MTRCADRLLALIEALRRRPVCTAGEFAAALEVSVRTVYRDADALFRNSASTVGRRASATRWTAPPPAAAGAFAAFRRKLAID